MAEKGSSLLELLSDAASQSVLELQQALKQRRAAATASQAALGQMPGIESEILSAQETSRTLLTRIAEVDSESRTASEALTRLRAIRDGAIGGVPEALRSRAALSEARKTAETRLKSIDDALAAARAAASETERDLVAATERARGAAIESESTSAALAAGLAEFERQRIDAGFASDAELAAARLPVTQVRDLDERIAAFDQSVIAATARADRAEIAARSLVAPDLPALQAAACDADQRLEESLKEQTQRESERERLDQALASLRRTTRTLEELDAQYAIIGQVSDVASGKNQAGLTFQRFVLTFLLDDVLVAATHRLRLMSRGRYQLQRRRDRADGRASAGLDLEVFDAYTGSARPVATLSGGESFLASLSLALGLADVVQARSGGIRLETLFIDEGFGSLDPEALDLALRALTDLMKDGRLVGIISHVPELREQVPARLEIVNDRRGSAARFVLG
jgi:exonuclease SbcC